MKNQPIWRRWHDSSKEPRPAEETWWTPEWFAAQWSALLNLELPGGALLLLLISLPVVIVISAGRIAAAAIRWFSRL